MVGPTRLGGHSTNMGSDKLTNPSGRPRKERLVYPSQNQSRQRAERLRFRSSLTASNMAYSITLNNIIFKVILIKTNRQQRGFSRSVKLLQAIAKNLHHSFQMM